MMTDFRFRPFDVEAVMACQRRNIEALSQANQLAVEAVQAVARRQIEIARQTLEDMSALLRDLAQPASTEDRIAKNTEYAKQMLEKSVSNGREITLLATKAGTEAADVLRKRACEGLDELRDLAKQQARPLIDHCRSASEAAPRPRRLSARRARLILRPASLTRQMNAGAQAALRRGLERERRRRDCAPRRGRSSGRARRLRSTGCARDRAG